MTGLFCCAGPFRGTTRFNVFKKRNGKIHHFWGSEMAFAQPAPGQHHRIGDLAEGRLAIVTNAGRDAVDAAASGRNEGRRAQARSKDAFLLWRGIRTSGAA
jgi:hypothetical protein